MSKFKIYLKFIILKLINHVVTMKISIIIVNWNGKPLLKKCMPSVIAAAEYVKKKYEIIVVDNGSIDGSINFLKTKFPKVRVISLKENFGLPKPNNLGAKAAKGDKLLFLNNDIMLKKDALVHMIKHFKKPNVFGVACKVLKWDKKTIQNEFLGCKFILGTAVQTQPGMNETDTNRFKEPRLTYYAPANSSMIDRKKFLKIGGFDKIYTPFYREEHDLSYRAYKRGWVVVYEPKAVAYHKHAATTSKTSTREELHLLELRNRFIFTWSNFYDPKILLKHFALLPIVFLRSAFISPYRNKRFLDVKAFFQALKYLDKIMKKRSREKKYAKLSDKEALDLINSNKANELAQVTYGKFLGKE